MAFERRSREPVPLRRSPAGLPRWALPTRRATTRLARRLATVLQAGDLLDLEGQLGTGKTFVVRALCRERGLPAAVPVTSPTFALVNEYRLDAYQPGAPPVVHADLYRVGELSEVERLGLRERRADALLLVEWGAAHIPTLGGRALCLRLGWAEVGRVAELSASDGPDCALLRRAAEAVGLTPAA